MQALLASIGSLSKGYGFQGQGQTLDAATSSQLRKDDPHCRIVSLVVRPRLREMLIQRNELRDLRHVEQRLALHAASELVGAQQLGSSGSHPIALRLDDAQSLVVDERKSSLALDRLDDDLIHSAPREAHALRRILPQSEPRSPALPDAAAVRAIVCRGRR